MKRQVLRFGIAFAIINVVTIFITLWVMDSQRYRLADVLGYTAIVLAALLVFFGVRSYRQNQGGGRLAFGRGLAVGLAITLLACFVHVAVFEVVYFGFVPGLGEKYAHCMVERERLAGATPAELVKAESNAQDFRKLLDQPLWNAALTFAGPFLTGLFASLVSAAILRTRSPA